MKKVQPLGDKILVKRIEAEEKTPGGIVVPDSAKEKPKEGEVVSLGTGKVNEKGEKQPFTVKVGDRVLFESFAGTEVKIGGEEHLVMREEDILGIVK